MSVEGDRVIRARPVEKLKGKLYRWEGSRQSFFIWMTIIGEV